MYLTCMSLLLFGALTLATNDFRIIGGSKTTIEQHPWDVSIQVSGTHTCGGSVIDTDVILTAAHCITESKVKKGLYTVVAGITDLRDEAPYTGNVARVIVHDKYNPKTYDSDIAIIKLETPLEYSSKIKPIELPAEDYEIPGDAVMAATGWGLTDAKGRRTADVLQEAIIKYVDWDTCYKALSKAGTFTERMFCAGYMDGSKDTCSGDSGGNIQLNSMAVGIVSWGAGCGIKGYPGAYTLVSYFRDWIKTNTGL